LTRTIAGFGFSVFSAELGRRESRLPAKSPIRRSIWKRSPLKQLREKTDFDIPASKLSPYRRSKAVEKTMADYVKMRSNYASAKNAGEWVSLGGCPRIAIVARAFLIEGCFSII